MKHFYLISVIAFALAFCFWLAEVETVPMALCIIGGVLFVVRYFHDYAKDPKPLKWKPKANHNRTGLIMPLPHGIPVIVHHNYYENQSG